VFVDCQVGLEEGKMKGSTKPERMDEPFSFKPDDRNHQSCVLHELGGNAPGIFVEKEDGKPVLRRGFQISPNEKFIVVKDVVTRGGRVRETIDIVHAHGGSVSAVGVIVDRSGDSKPDFGCPFLSLIEMTVETFPADNLPPDLVTIPAVKPGSR
jgi:orotate phosphoribosyltransferase